METSDVDGPLEWTRPDQVMKLHRFKMKKSKLSARIRGMNASKESPKLLTKSNQPSVANNESLKRKNPFAKNDVNKRQRDSLVKSDLDLSLNDNSTLELLKVVSPNTLKLEEILNTSSPSSSANASYQSSLKIYEGKSYIPIDWTLKSKIRLMSLKPFAFNGKLKASEEASGTTGFVRCVDIGDKQITLDTSPNARFHQCCLVWQYPSIPWLNLFPRSSKLNIISGNSSLTLPQAARQALYQEWHSSFCSLFHLLRVGQCPYFYLCGNNFTALFRAAGICGISEVHALMTPTTKGLRDLIKSEDIQFTMPLKKKKTFNFKDDDEEMDENEEQSNNWLKSIGFEESEISKINYSQNKITSKKESERDNLNESLIFVMGVETQALFNFIMNCKTLTTTTGPLAHIPPTLLSPVAFHGAALKPLKVRENTVFDGKEKYYSLEISGPILPAVIPSLCSFITSSQLDKFSISCAYVPISRAFSLAKHGKDEEKDTKEPHSIFGIENLTDCGFNKEMLSHFCSSDVNRIQNFDSLTYTSGSYTWE